VACCPQHHKTVAITTREKLSLREQRLVEVFMRIGLKFYTVLCCVWFVETQLVGLAFEAVAVWVGGAQTMPLTLLLPGNL